jgi:hypothetical protein
MIWEIGYRDARITGLGNISMLVNFANLVQTRIIQEEGGFNWDNLSSDWPVGKLVVYFPDYDWQEGQAHYALELPMGR